VTIPRERLSFEFSVRDQRVDGSPKVVSGIVEAWCLTIFIDRCTISVIENLRERIEDRTVGQPEI
jgi:hypothetical protein